MMKGFATEEVTAKIEDKRETRAHSLGSHFPRVLIAGTAGDSGKTLITLAIVRGFLKRGIRVQTYKKGPDYIDARWLGWASQRDARNLDTFLIGEDKCFSLFCRHALQDGINIIEGNRGLFDGLDAAGTHSSAALARLVAAPVLLVLPVRKLTATAAAIVLGMATMDSEVRIAGVILNRVANKRHEMVVRESIEKRTGIPVLGAVPSLSLDPLPERHLGLVPVEETTETSALEGALEKVCSALDLDAIEAVARSAPPLTEVPLLTPSSQEEPCVRIGVFKDAAFSFYYPENLEALREQGAELIFISPLKDQELPKVHALYIGGGFPETHASALAQNRALREAVKAAAQAGLPVYAECGGLMYLAEAIVWEGEVWEMAGVLPIEVQVFREPKGHGYVEIEVVEHCAFYDEGTVLRGHEFHYSAIAKVRSDLKTVFLLRKGQGAFSGRDGIVWKNVLATYVHVHAAGTPSWAKGLVRAAKRYKSAFERSE